MPYAEPRPLSARSVVLSLLLGAHPQPMTARQLTKAGEHLGISPATLRVALTRAVSAGELSRDAAGYHLGERLLERQHRQDEAVEDAETDWDGDWEMAVVVVSGRSSAERAALRVDLETARLAELREGVWTRPANLRRAPAYADNPVLTCFRSRPTGEAAQLALDLWDLDAWATETRRLLGGMRGRRSAVKQLAVAAQAVRHLTTDPLLPSALLPSDWPGDELRAAYAAYQTRLRDLALS
ncbi:PaaX family transcriptional regulator C-terminal domain-containing protein [Luteipulveratus halotolerans]|uniref:PaaX domain-containing protein, C-domain protein n=1 Tax=Luteipulveratus halotolerans TaxID=1631356 RepID=A0A0L6CKX5_9MICO|nr:PaaX family transcriptional regulator C-terminal domain-containing protein [Luteipulveratus halotolerans]KNX38412.1 PaaX domain-containing protein, C- domain protein [Luteipulveratus halotolerans]